MGAHSSVRLKGRVDCCTASLLPVRGLGTNCRWVSHTALINVSCGVSTHCSIWTLCTLWFFKHFAPYEPNRAFAPCEVSLWTLWTLWTQWTLWTLWTLGMVSANGMVDVCAWYHDGPRVITIIILPIALVALYYSRHSKITTRRFTWPHVHMRAVPKISLLLGIFAQDGIAKQRNCFWRPTKHFFPGPQQHIYT